MIETTVTFSRQSQMNIVSFEVSNYPLSGAIIAADYSYVNDIIEKYAENLMCRHGKRYASLWCPKRPISTKEAIESIESMTCVIEGNPYKGRPGKLEDLASHDSTFSGKLGKADVGVLGEKFHHGSDAYVAYRTFMGSKYRLHLDFWRNGWSSRCHLLIVFEPVLDSK